MGYNPNKFFDKSKRRGTAMPNSNEFGLAVAWQKNESGFKRPI